jgi:hypothetical protein
VSVVSLGRRFGVGRCRVSLEEHPPACAGRNAAARGRGRRPRVVRLVVVRAVGRGTGAGQAALHGAHRDGRARPRRRKRRGPRPAAARAPPTGLRRSSAPGSHSTRRRERGRTRVDPVRGHGRTGRARRGMALVVTRAETLRGSYFLNCVFHAPRVVTALRASRLPPAGGRTRCPRRHASP